MRNNGESDESFKKRFTAEQSRPFDILQAKEATLRMVVQKGQVSFPSQGTS